MPEKAFVLNASVFKMTKNNANREGKYYVQKYEETLKSLIQ